MEVPFSTLGKTQNYSFGKAKRFLKGDSPQGREFLNLVDPFKTRACSFGYGERSQLINKFSVKTPSPASYSVTPEPGMSLTFVQRPDAKYGFERNRNYPGPGSYSPNDNQTLYHTFSLSRRDLYKFQYCSPGPGAYQPITKLVDKGTIGGFMPKAKKTVPVSERRKKSSPGPGAYKLVSCFGEDRLKYPKIKYRKK
jgi:hypothetical protein